MTGKMGRGGMSYLERVPETYKRDIIPLPEAQKS